jgi:hypothetical protein
MLLRDESHNKRIMSFSVFRRKGFLKCGTKPTKIKLGFKWEIEGVLLILVFELQGN